MCLRTREVITMFVEKFANTMVSVRRCFGLFATFAFLLAIFLCGPWCPKENTCVLLSTAPAFAADRDRPAKPAKQLKTTTEVPDQSASKTDVPMNEAGTVRVNNLANLEALLNIIANLLEITFVLAGFVFLCYGFAITKAVSWVFSRIASISPLKQVAIGVSLVVIGLAIPGVINWFVASVRDGGGFS
jgi:hypothetical protein